MLHVSFGFCCRLLSRIQVCFMFGIKKNHATVPICSNPIGGLELHYIQCFLEWDWILKFRYVGV